MRIGIDISQLAYENTGVANYLKQLMQYMIRKGRKHDYVLFYSSLRMPVPLSVIDFVEKNQNVLLKQYKFPQSVLHVWWNILHILPIELLIGNIDIFISSDWTYPPTRKAKKVTIIYDMIVYTYPEETARKIITTQKKRLARVKKDCDLIFCISEATKQDVIKILGIKSDILKVIYPGQTV